MRGRSLSLITGSIDNRMFIKTVTGVSERSQQRGDLKDEEYNITTNNALINNNKYYFSIAKIKKQMSNNTTVPLTDF
ncbi:hypothetical protein Xbud_03346 [Xenorhabdus budapestensis]|uniref:Uncharacterized protein n=1 Tax=Xenorhabdus budapestensis TaxID=290110 RepID=A0A2D0IQW9_XENBU|nr:hypothetical protein Xbud_03346 [Xenorhabdus budapestensis]